MHGLGNDFVFLDCMDGSATALNLSAIARKVCDRHFSIGADGLLVIMPHPTADCRMRIFNADGSEAEMCGNGIRCVGKYIFDRHITDSHTPTVATAAGIKHLSLTTGPDGTAETVSVDMGIPGLDPHTTERLITILPGVSYKVTAVNVGNPHGVVFVPSASGTPVEEHGPLLECHPIWPDKANIEFVEVFAPSRLRQRTWERGVGITLSCGTGACAAATAAVATCRAAWPVEVLLDGGLLSFDQNPDGHIIMTGPATFLFHAEIKIASV